MARQFKRLSDLEWKLFEDIFPLIAGKKRAGDASCAVSSCS